MWSFWSESTNTRKISIIISILLLIGCGAMFLEYKFTLRSHIIEMNYQNGNKVTFKKNEDNSFSIEGHQVNENSVNEKDTVHTSNDVVAIQANVERTASIAPTKEEYKQLPKIAVMVANAGLSKTTTNAINALPQQVAVGITPYASEISMWVDLFTAKGHDIYAGLPLESTVINVDNGYLALLSYNTKENNLKNFHEILDKFKTASGVGIAGIYVLGDEGFSGTDQAMEVFSEIKRSVKQTLYLNSSLPKYTKALFESTNIDYIFGAIVVDDTLAQDSINYYLSVALERAKKDGSCLIVLRPYPISVMIVEKWLEEMINNGSVQLVRINELGKQGD